MGSTSYRGNMSLIRLISSLPALHTLDLCKSPEPQATPWLGRLGSQSGTPLPSHSLLSSVLWQAPVQTC